MVKIAGIEQFARNVVIFLVDAENYARIEGFKSIKIPVCILLGPRGR